MAANLVQDNPLVAAANVDDVQQHDGLESAKGPG